MISTTNKLLEESISDLREDFDELLYLVMSQRERLEIYKKDVEKVQTHLRPVVYKKFSVHYSKNIVINNGLITEINKVKNQLVNTVSPKKFDTLYEKKLNVAEKIRIHYSETAAFITSVDWQSPSYLHSQFSMAGKQTGRIVGTENDYKRDQHYDTIGLENKFKQEYIDGFFKMSIQPLATSSGMAAFTTILNFLQMKRKINGPILIGKSIYFENKTLVTNIFKNVVEVDEGNIKEVFRMINKIKPKIIIFDSLTNTKDIVVPKLDEIVKFLIKTVKKDTYLIIDNTGLSVSNQILKQTIGRSAFLHTIVFESLNKYYQFGMDRVTGGMIWIQGKEGYDLFRSREFSGTIISDTSAQSVPLPNRKLLTKRLERLSRNTQLLAGTLQYFVENNETIISNIVYPGLSNHSSFSWNKDAAFHGSFFVIAFKKKFQKIPIYKKFVEFVIKEASKQQIDINAGTSFGFNTTRVYLTALHSEFGDPFIRVSVGSESRVYVEKLSEVFKKVLAEIR